MTKQDKVKLIKKLYQKGRIKRLEKGAFSMPGELFVKGITARLISETLKGIE